VRFADGRESLSLSAFLGAFPYIEACFATNSPYGSRASGAAGGIDFFCDFEIPIILQLSRIALRSVLIKSAVDGWSERVPSGVPSTTVRIAPIRACISGRIRIRTSCFVPGLQARRHLARM
jgi:hypothetical protein